MYNVNLVKGDDFLDIAVIGGGASGLCAVIEAKRTAPDIKVTVYEHLQKLAKKILVTGNGRCNFTNENLSLNHFYGNEAFLKELLCCKYANSVDFFKSLGVLTYCEDGRIYPRSQQSSAIREVLLNEVLALKAEIVTDTKILSIKKENGLFIVDGKKYNAVIIAGGGKASPVQGSDGSCYKLLADFGHKINTPYPALCGLTSGEKFLSFLKGVRCEAKASLYCENKLLGEEIGEIQFTEKAVSGIPVMNLSHLVKNKKNTTLHLDLCEELTKEELINLINHSKNKSPNIDIETALSGIINSKLSFAIVEKSNIKKHTQIASLNSQQISTIANELKCFKISISGTRDFSNAQITCGGASLCEFDSRSLMSELCKGLFACGEILDIHGDCGGYNLHLAWTTGRLAGASAAKYLIKSEG